MRLEGPGWSDSGPSPLRTVAGTVYLTSAAGRNHGRPVQNSALSEDVQQLPGHAIWLITMLRSG
jgi:hypothetical protein